MDLHHLFLRSYEEGSGPRLRFLRCRGIIDNISRDDEANAECTDGGPLLERTLAADYGLCHATNASSQSESLSR